MNLSVYIFMYKWCRANWHCLKHGNILHKTLKHGNIFHKKGVKLNAPFLSRKQQIYLLFLITSWLPPSFAAHFCTQFTKLRDSSWYMVAVSFWMACFGSWIVCVCVCVRACMCAIPVYIIFQIFPLGRRQGPWGLVTVWSMGFQIHETAVCCSWTH